MASPRFRRRQELAAARLRNAGIAGWENADFTAHSWRGRNPEKALRANLAAVRRREAGRRAEAEAATKRAARAEQAARRRHEQQLRRRRQQRPKRTPSRQKLETPAGTITTSRQLRVIKKAVRDAAAAGERIAFRATFTDGNGRTRTRYLDGSAGGVGGTGAGFGQSPQGPVVAVSIPTWVGDDGYDPNDIIDMWDDLDGWDWLIDMWDESYSEDAA